MSIICWWRKTIYARDTSQPASEHSQVDGNRTLKRKTGYGTLWVRKLTKLDCQK